MKTIKEKLNEIAVKNQFIDFYGLIKSESATRDLIEETLSEAIEQYENQFKPNAYSEEQVKKTNPIYLLPSHASITKKALDVYGNNESEINIERHKAYISGGVHVLDECIKVLESLSVSSPIEANPYLSSENNSIVIPKVECGEIPKITMEEAVSKGYTHFAEEEGGYLKKFSEINEDERQYYKTGKYYVIDMATPKQYTIDAKTIMELISEHVSGQEEMHDEDDVLLSIVSDFDFSKVTSELNNEFSGHKYYEPLDIEVIF